MARATVRAGVAGRAGTEGPGPVENVATSLRAPSPPWIVTVTTELAGHWGRGVSVTSRCLPRYSGCHTSRSTSPVRTSPASTRAVTSTETGPPFDSVITTARTTALVGTLVRP